MPAKQPTKAELLKENQELRLRLAQAQEALRSAGEAPGTQCEHVEDALRESEGRLRTVLDNSRDGINMLDLATGRYVFMSSAQAEMTGFTAEELCDMTAQAADERVHPEDRDISVTQQRRVAAGEDLPEPVEYRWKVKSGEYRWFSDSRQLVRDAQGRPVAMVGVSRDITARKLAESNQRLVNDILRVVNRGVGDLHCLMKEMLRLLRESTGFDAVGLRLRLGENFPYFEHDGFSDEFLREENFLCAKRGDGSTIRDDQGQAVLECTCGLVLSGRTDPTLPFFTEGGSFWTNVSSDLLALTPEVDPRTNPRNRCIHVGYQSVALIPVRAAEEIIGLLQLNGRREGCFTPESIRFYESLADNIGLALQRKRAEEALRESEARFRSMFEGHGAVMLLLERNTGRIVDANDAAARFYGYSREQLRSMRVTQINQLPPPEVSAELRNAASVGKNHFLFPHRLAGGEVRWVEVYSSAVSIKDQPMLFSVIHDVTARREAEEALRRLNAELEAVNDGLAATADELARSNQELEAFAYIAGHDLQEPLRNISGFAMLIQERYKGQLDARGDEYIGFMYEGAQRMSQMISDLLAYSRVGTKGKQFMPVDMNSIVEYARGNLQAAIAEAGATVTSDALPTMSVDATQMGQLFQNLIGNAIKFRAPGRPPEVHVSAQREGEHWLVRIRDNGIGIEPSQAQRVFVLFQRLHTRDKYEGMGIGLAICKKIIEGHGGKIWVESKPGEGSTFCFTLPCPTA